GQAESAQGPQLQDAEEEVDRIRKLVMSLPAGVELVRADLLAQYNKALERLGEVKRHHGAMALPPASLPPGDVDELLRRTQDVKSLWLSARRTNEDRKRLLRAVLADVILHRADRESADIEIVWKGGLRERMP